MFGETESASKELTIKLSKPHPAQQSVIDAIEQYRFIVLNAGRRFGKTDLMVNITAKRGLEKKTRIAYISLTHRNISEYFNRVLDALSPVVEYKNETDLTIRLKNGTVIECWSVSAITASRGRSFETIFVDESAHIPDLDKVFLEVLRPMQLDYSRHGDPKTIFVSTPSGKQHYFYDLFVYGQDPLKTDYCSFQFPSTANPLISPDELESIRETTPKLIFDQEYLAMFSDDNSIFKNIELVSIGQRKEPDYTHGYVAGIDWGQSNDYTVMSILDVSGDKPVQVEMYRWNSTSYSIMRNRIKEVTNKYKITAILAETNSMGTVNIEGLQVEGLPVQGFTTTSVSKRPLIEALAVAIEQEKIILLNDQTQKNELYSFVAKQTASGYTKYEASGVNHDDTVIALALAYKQAMSWNQSLILFDY